MTATPPRVVLEPDAAQWSTLTTAGRSAPAGPISPLQFRRELGLPEGRPAIMTGHQAAFWHPGILAKLFAAREAASALGGHPVWLVVDHDEHELQSLRIPVRDRREVLRVEELPIPRAALPVGAPAALVPAFDPAPMLPQDAPALPSVRRGLERIRSALASHRGAASAAEQVTRATADLLSPLVAMPPTLFATSIARTATFERLVEHMRADPVACARAYNTASAATPEAGIPPLLIDAPESVRVELPLWWLAPGRPRRRVYASELSSPPPGHSLAPRALFLTATLRLAACDLFIHGLGGGVYDKATELWIKRWLGAALAPAVVVSADLLLPLQDTTVSPADVAAASWTAHRARHDPAVLGLHDLAARKASLVAEVARSRASPGLDPRAAYIHLHAMLDDYRQAHARTLIELEHHAAHTRARAAEAPIATDRTWAFPLHDQERLESLRLHIADAFRSVDRRTASPVNDPRP